MEQQNALAAIEAFERERTSTTDTLAQQAVSNARTRMSPHTNSLLNAFHISIKRYQGTVADNRFKESCRKDVRRATSFWSIDGHGLHDCEAELAAWTQRQAEMIERKDADYGRDIVIPDH
jgi:hypothetical protein